MGYWNVKRAEVVELRDMQAAKMLAAVHGLRAGVLWRCSEPECGARTFTGFRSPGPGYECVACGSGRKPSLVCMLGK